MQAAGLEVTLIKDVTPVPHNGAAHKATQSMREADNEQIHRTCLQIVQA